MVSPVIGEFDFRRGLGQLRRLDCAADCEAAMVPYATCQTSNCATNCPTGKTGPDCTCSEACQKCFDDVYSTCGGCESKDGESFDLKAAPQMKTGAEAIGCSGCYKSNILGMGSILAMVAVAMM